MTFRTLTILAVGGLIGAASSPAHGRSSLDDGLAQTASSAGAPETRSQAISYTDLDLSTSEGASVLVGRINNAARTVCSPSPVHAASFQENADYERCMRQATGQAVNGLGNRDVTYAYKRRHQGW